VCLDLDLVVLDLDLDLVLLSEPDDPLLPLDLDLEWDLVCLDLVCLDLVPLVVLDLQDLHFLVLLSEESLLDLDCLDFFE
jgi:hypothetical protein